MHPFHASLKYEILEKLVHGFVTLHESERFLVVKHENVDFCCKAQYVENEVVSANFELNSQPSSAAEVTRILPVKLIDSSALQEVFSYEIPIQSFLFCMNYFVY